MQNFIGKLHIKEIFLNSFNKIIIFVTSDYMSQMHSKKKFQNIMIDYVNNLSLHI